MDRDVLLKIHAGELTVLVNQPQERELRERDGSGI